ncbi:PLP-dependent aminotransferase family protein [uncultured Clostridium sp.]|uniref:MocR-like pyridoxine biosynthesis transcription factor PdxR n=1 Tax=uncultured Clostridium sp. TaxID=59620 RepID=UPI00262311B5|nr:PLP-dependent aminotransferase family protein [uncultured Clostridium sp.]
MWIDDICFKEEESKYIEIYLKIKENIENGNIEDGQRLPSIRGLSLKLNVNKITVISAYNKLKQEGYAYQKIGSGTYAKRKEIPFNFRREYSKTFKMIQGKDIDFVDFTGETTKEIFFPIKDFKEIINKVLDRDGEEVLLTQDALGYEPLRKTINSVFWGNKIDYENILIVSGAQQGIDIASKAMLNINENIVVEKPTYGGALSVFKWKKANIIEIPMENDGINIKEFEDVLKKHKIRLLYVMSYFQNPTGSSYSLEKKKKILELANKYDFYIIEDDYLSELIYEKTLEYIPFKKLDKDDRVVYIKSFSKIFLPGIRLGYIITPAKFKENFSKTKFNTDISTSSLMQRALEYYIKNCGWKKNIIELSKEYKRRYTFLENEINLKLSEYVTYRKPKGGLNFYLELKSNKITSRELFFRLREKNVFITPGVLFFKNKEEGDRSFRLGFSQTDREKIEIGIDIIKEELDVIYNYKR